ncbi:hypothetical protein D4R75_08935 [bacterium]|nr:MAG: hypothetical protein D4R75_08935 [bacterium]
MNFFTETNEEIKTAVAALLNAELSSIKRVTFAVSYPQNRKPSVVTIEVSPSPTLQCLLFIYTRGRTLYDVISYRSKRFVRVSKNREAIEHIDRINHYLLTHVANVMPYAPKSIHEEDNDEQEKLKQKDLQLQQLKDRNRVDKNTIQSLRSQMKMLRQRK